MIKFKAVRNSFSVLIAVFAIMVCLQSTATWGKSPYAAMGGDFVNKVDPNGGWIITPRLAQLAYRLVQAGRLKVPIEGSSRFLAGLPHQAAVRVNDTGMPHSQYQTIANSSDPAAVRQAFEAANNMPDGSDTGTLEWTFMTTLDKTGAEIGLHSGMRILGDNGAPLASRHAVINPKKSLKDSSDFENKTLMEKVLMERGGVMIGEGKPGAFQLFQSKFSKFDPARVRPTPTTAVDRPYPFARVGVAEIPIVNASKSAAIMNAYVAQGKEDIRGQGLHDTQAAGSCATNDCTLAKELFSQISDPIAGMPFDPTNPNMASAIPAIKELMEQYPSTKDSQFRESAVADEGAGLSRYQHEELHPLQPDDVDAAQTSFIEEFDKANAATNEKAEEMFDFSDGIGLE